MNLSWLFRKKMVEPLHLSDVKAAPPPNPSIERERDIIGFKIQAEGLRTAVLAGQLQETLAAGVLLELRGGRP
jgi:hypothetical protein